MSVMPTFVHDVDAASDVVLSVPPKPRAASCAPALPGLTQAESVYVPLGRLAIVWPRLEVPVSCQDHRPGPCGVCTLEPLLVVHPAGVVMATRSASNEGLRT